MLVAAVRWPRWLALLQPPRPRPHVCATPRVPEPVPDAEGWLRRHRGLWSLLGRGRRGDLRRRGGRAGRRPVVGRSAVWVVVGRAEPAAGPAPRATRSGATCPRVVLLLAAALRSGAAARRGGACWWPGPCPGRRPTGSPPLAARLALGVPAATVWADLAADPDLAPLGRTMARAHDTGAPVVAAVERLADELAAAGRADVEDRARAVGVRAAVPLGLCLLPAFVLVGIVPLVAGLLGSIAW